MGLSIKEEMKAIDTKDRSWYDELTDEERKKVGIWVLMRYTCSLNHNIKDFEEHYLEWTNELVNVHHNTLRHHPQLQFQLLQAVGLGKTMFHPWIAPGKKKKQNKFINYLTDQLTHLNDDEIFLYEGLIENKRSYLEECGLDKKQIKELLK
jgi:hypothetical protein